MIAWTWVLVQALGGTFHGTMWRGPEVIGVVEVQEDGDVRTLRTELAPDAGGSRWVEVQTLGDRPGRSPQAELRYTPTLPAPAGAPDPTQVLRAAAHEATVSLTLGPVQRQFRVGQTPWFLHHREHLAGLFDLVDGVPRVADARRSFDGMAAGRLLRGRWTAWYEGTASITSVRDGSEHTLHAFRVEGPGMLAQVYLDRAGAWARLEALGDELPGLLLESDRWPELAAVPSRTPVPPIPGEEPVAFDDADGGTVLGRWIPPAAPSAEGGPAVLFLWGSGAHDANGDGPDGRPPRGAPLLDLVRALSGRGVASLRLEEAGEPDRGGSRSLTARTGTARAALEFLAVQDGVDAGRIAVVGHSEGCLVAARLAAGGGVRATAWMAPPAEPLPDLLRTQTARILRLQGAGEDTVAQAIDSLDAFLAALAAAGDEAPAVLPDAGWWQVGGPDWWREHRDLDPLSLAQGVSAPVLVVHGDRDRNVPASHGVAWQAALRAAAVPVVRQVIPGADHFLVPNPSGDPLRSAETDRSMDAAAVRILRDWLLRALAGDGPG